MRRCKRLKKLVIGGVLLFTIGVLPLTGCTMFGEDGFVITDISWSQETEGSDVIVLIKTTRDENPDITLSIPAGNGIKNVEAEMNSKGDIMTINITYTDPNVPPTTFNIPIVHGKDGKGIKDIEVSKDENGEVSIRFIYTDSTSSNLIHIPSGKDGASIKDITTDELSDGENIIITITFTDDSEPKVIKVKKPRDGVSISIVEYNAEKSDDDNYVITITYSDDFKQDITLPRPKSTIWLHGEHTPTSEIGKDGDYYLNITSGFVYYKEFGVWRFIFSMKGSGSYSEMIVNFHPDKGGNWIYPSLVENATYSLPVEYGGYVPLSMFPVLAKEGYTFAGWFTAKEGQINAGQFTDLTPVFKNLDLYPRWDVN